MEFLDRLSEKNRKLYIAAQERELAKKEADKAKLSVDMDMRDEAGRIITIHLNEYIPVL